MGDEVACMKLVLCKAHYFVLTIISLSYDLLGRTGGELERLYHSVSTVLSDVAKNDTSMSHKARGALDDLDSFYDLARQMKKERKDLKRKCKDCEVRHKEQVTRLEQELQKTRESNQALQTQQTTITEKLSQQNALVKNLTDSKNKLEQEVTDIKQVKAPEDEHKKHVEDQLAQAMEGLNLNSISAPTSPR